MYLDITTEPACCCAVRFKDNNTSEYIVQGKSHWQAFGADNFSVECWIRPEIQSPGFAFAPIISYHDINNNQDRFWRLDLFKDTGALFPRFIIGYEPGGGVIAREWTSTEPLTLGQWYHIVVNKISSYRENFEMYVNGVRMIHKPFVNPNNESVLFCAPNGQNYDFFFGGYLTPAETGYYSGGLAQVRIYSETLGIAEVKFNHEYGFYKPYSIEFLRMWTPFNNCEGSLTGALIGSISAGPSYAAVLSGFGTRSNYGGGAWIDTCFSEPGLSCWNPQGSAVSCPDPRIEDNLIINLCDQLTLPHMFPFDNFAGEEIGLELPPTDPGLCYGCGLEQAQVRTLLVNVKQRYESFVTMAFSVSDLVENLSKIQIAYSLCINNIPQDEQTAVITPVTTNIFDFFNLIQDAVIADLSLPFGLTYETGEFKLKIGLGSCMDITFLTRKLDTVSEFDIETDAFDGVVFTRRRYAYNCQIPETCEKGGSYIIINYSDMCLTKTQELTCTVDKVIDIKADCNITVPTAQVDCEDRTVNGTFPRLCFAYGNGTEQSVNFFSQPVEIGRDCESMLIRYRNDNELFKVQRVRANVKKGGYKKTQEISNSSKGITRKLMSQITDTYEMETDFYSRRWHDAMLRALESDFIEVFIAGDWIRVVTEDTYSIDWDQEAMPLKGKGTATLMSYKYKYLNNFC